MKKRIFIDMMLLTTVSLVLVTTALCLYFYGVFSREMRAELRDRVRYFENDSAESARADIDAFPPSEMRVTLIAADGAVLYDNTVGRDAMENHADREEVRKALTLGFGESVRFSDTLRQETYYCSIRLTDGNVLRVSKSARSVYGMFEATLPVVAGIVLLLGALCYFAAARLTRHIVRPINSVEPDARMEAPYDELAPFVRTIVQQRERIAHQLSDLSQRTDTIAAIMDNMAEGIVLLDAQGALLSLNKSAAAMFDAETAQLGRSMLELTRDLDLNERARAALAGKRSEMNLTRAGKIYRAIFSPVREGGAILLFMDITDRTTAETMRREFSANVSHELKTPLTSIYGNAEMLADGMVREEDKRAFYDKIKDEAARLIALIEDIIMISRLDEGVEKPVFEPVSLADLAGEAAGALFDKAREHEVRLSVLGTCGSVRANPSMIYEMLYNLIDNAIKYNRRGGSVIVALSQTPGGARVCVEDTGIGIPSEAQPHVFERFYRVDKSRSKMTGGTGLGLAIVKHIALAHGGSVGLDSKVGVGTTVEVVLPEGTRG